MKKELLIAYEGNEYTIEWYFNDKGKVKFWPILNLYQ